MLDISVSYLLQYFAQICNHGARGDIYAAHIGLRYVHVGIFNSRMIGRGLSK